VDWSVVLFIATFIPVGEAMLRTGLAGSLASVVLAPEAWLPPPLAAYAAVSALYLATSVLTETVTNNAAAIVLTPVAVSMADALGVDARPFIFAVCFAASASFMTPTGYQTNMMVYGPGSYRFTDFTRFGVPLNLVFWLVASLLIPVFWPL
jgi:di/tricarboxylate transporter